MPLRQSVGSACRGLLTILMAGCGHAAGHASAASPPPIAGQTVAVLQDFTRELAQVHARNPAIALRIDRHPATPSERVLIVEYPPVSNDPAGRDVWCDVAFTTWVDLPDTTWQSVRLELDKIRPNPYFQPPDAIAGRPQDLSEVNGLGFAPQDRAAGRLVVGAIVLSR